MEEARFLALSGATTEDHMLSVTERLMSPIASDLRCCGAMVMPQRVCKEGAAERLHRVAVPCMKQLQTGVKYRRNYL